MKKPNFIKKPLLTFFVLIFVVASIVYIESQKPDLSKAKVNTDLSNEKQSKYPKAPDFVDNIRTPEIYFGYQFSRGNFGNPEGLKPNQIIEYRFPSSITPNNVYLEGRWKNNADNMELVSDEGSILLIFHAKAVNIVAGSENGSEAFVFLDNEFENERNKGTDVIITENKSTSNIKEFKLYNLASAENYDTHAIDINIEGKGFKVYTFTFG